MWQAAKKAAAKAECSEEIAEAVEESTEVSSIGKEASDPVIEREADTAYDELFEDDDIVCDSLTHKDILSDSDAAQTYRDLFSDDQVETITNNPDIPTEVDDALDSSLTDDTFENASDETEARGLREMTDIEKQELRDELGWSDKQIEKCTVDKDNTIHYKTDNCDLAGKVSETGVPYERRIIEIKGKLIEGAFPKFTSAFNTELSPNRYQSKTYAIDCTRNLREAIGKDSELKKQFTEEQVKDIEAGRTPTGYVWHHNEMPGQMQLVKDTDHRLNRHTGGNALWGPDSVNKGHAEVNFNE